MSRPLLYMHLDRLEKAGLVDGHLELSDDGKAMKYFELIPFELRVTAETVISALAADQDHEQARKLSKWRRARMNEPLGLAAARLVRH